MTQAYDFNTTKWENDFVYAKSPHIADYRKYAPAENGVLKNGCDPTTGAYDYVSVISKKKYKVGTEIKATFSFSGHGAPCLVFTNELSGDGDFLEYGLHFEVCTYFGGVNVWHIIKDSERVGNFIKPTKVCFEKWDVSQDNVECTVRIDEKKITVFIEGREISAEHEDFPSEFHVGFTSCEGPCSFTSFSISDGE